MSKINCKAERCTYNDACACTAPVVEVCCCGCTEAKTSDETECHSFRDRHNQG